MASKVKYSELKNSDFFEFFNLHKVQSSKSFESSIIKKYKPGGFQGHIDIEFEVKGDEIVRAILLLDREWIGNVESLNLFGKDIAKSFIAAVVPPKEKESVRLLVHYLFNMKGTKDIIIPCERVLHNFEESSPEVKAILDIYRNINQSIEFPLENSKFTFENVDYEGKLRLLIVWSSNI